MCETRRARHAAFAVVIVIVIVSNSIILIVYQSQSLQFALRFIFDRYFCVKLNAEQTERKEVGDGK